MKKFTLAIATLVTVACSEDTTDSGVAKVDVTDPAAMLDPDGDGQASAKVEGDVASMDLELDDPLPELPFRIDGTEDAAVLDVVAALEIVVSSPDSGTSVSLTSDGTMVPSPPSGPGEWSVELSDDRRKLTFTFYNETREGLTLKVGKAYDVVYSLGENCCVGEVPATSTTFKLQ
ncbi:MAG: hypothetical protein U0168_28095 [Nannocystaceae bacterium]